MFRIYLTCDHADFSEMVKSENRLWTQGRLTDTHVYSDLMEVSKFHIQYFFDNEG